MIPLLLFVLGIVCFGIGVVKVQKDPPPDWAAPTIAGGLFLGLLSMLVGLYQHL
jgi:hypothetical protein